MQVSVEASDEVSVCACNDCLCFDGTDICERWLLKSPTEGSRTRMCASDSKVSVSLIGACSQTASSAMLQLPGSRSRARISRWQASVDDDARCR